MKKNVNTVAILNIISTLILQGIVFITTPIFTRIMGSEQFGIYSLFNSWVSIFTCAMGLSMTSALGSGMYYFKEKYINFRNSIMLCSTIICFIQIIIVFLFKDFLSLLLGFNSFLIVIIAITSACRYIVLFCQNAFTFEKRALYNLIMSVALSISSVAISILLIEKYYTVDRYLGRVFGVFISYGIIAIIVFIILFKEKPIGISREYCFYGAKLGIPIIFHSLSLNVLIQSDRVMMQFLGVSKSIIGIYSLFYSLCSVLTIILSALNNSWCPFFYDELAGENNTKIDMKVRNFIELFTVISVGFLLLSREVSYIMADSSFWSGINIIPILTIGAYFTFMYQIPVNIEFFYKKTRLIAIGTLAAGFINIVLNIVMIPLWGMYGAAISTAISYLILFIAHKYLVKNIKVSSYKLNTRIFIYGLFCLIVGCFAFYLLGPWWYIRWGLGLFIGCFELYRIYKRKTIF